MPPPALPIRLVARLVRRRYLRGPLPPGFRIPGAPGGTYATDPMTTEEGAARLREALGRLERGEPPTHASPVFGRLTLDEWRQLNLRHAELHLGFLHPTAG